MPIRGTAEHTEPPPFELFALRYAEHSGRRAQENFLSGDAHEQGSSLDYFIWLARRGKEQVVIDTGFGPEAAMARGRRLTRSPVEILRLLDVTAAEVPEVILTHLHYDHAGGLGDFPSALFHLQEAEAADATGPRMCDPRARSPFDVGNLEHYLRKLFSGRIRFHRGDVELRPGLWLHAIPGHSAGLQAVRVLTARGWVVLASDAAHLHANMARRGFDPLTELAPSRRRATGCSSRTSHRRGRPRPPDWRRAPVEDLGDVDWDRAIEVNQSAPFRLIRACLPGMRRAGWGRIINMGSVYGLIALPGRADYVTTKHALIGLTRTVALELAETAITCNAICPGLMATDSALARIGALAAERRISPEEATALFLASRQPGGKFIPIETVTALALFLCGPTSAGINGAAIPVDNGWSFA